MNREIKFRGWITTKAKILSWEDLWELEDLYEVFAAHLGPQAALNYPNAPILMQYTGLKDKNGKEIYEGDIVRLDKQCGFADRILYDFPERTGVVEYHSASYYMARDTSSMLSYCVYASDYTRFMGEVIGNIYENPELLS